jgi:exonuclease III
MNHNINLNVFSRGRLCVPVDGDAAVQEEQTALRPEAGSINRYVNDSPGGGVVGRETPILFNQSSETQNINPTIVGEDQERQTLSRHDLTLIRLKRLQEKKKEIWSGINKKHGIRIASLNAKGRNKKGKSKWPSIVTMMRKQRILVLGLQETHLDEEEAEKIRKTCPKIELISNGISKSKEGIALAINKELANNMAWNHTDLIEGRASRLSIKVEENRGMDIILIYAPNGDNEKIEFFTELREKLAQEQNIENIVIMGDFNSVESKLDRFPHREDENAVTDSWKKIKKERHLVDGWRTHNELNKGYTFTQPAERLPHPRKAAGAQITQSRHGEVVTINNNIGPSRVL